MKRKIVRQGTSTMMVSLPSKWVKSFNLEKGDDVDLTESGKELIIRAEKIKKGKKEITFEITNENKKDLRVILTHAYRKGFERVIIKNFSSEYLKEIKEITNNLLLGFEVTEVGSEKCVIENISEPTSDKYEIMQKKVFMIINENLEIIYNDFNSGKLKNLAEVEEIRNQQDKFILFCKRCLSSKLFVNNMEIEWELLTFIMHINHGLYYFYKYCCDNKIKPEKQMISLIKSLQEYFSFFSEAYYKKDILFIHKINSLKQKYQFGECIKNIETGKGKNAVVYSYIREIFRLIQIGASPILTEILEKDLSSN